MQNAIMDGRIIAAALLALTDQLSLDCKARLVRFPCKTRYRRIHGFSL